MVSRQSKIDSIKRLIDPSSGATDGERQAAKAALERILKSQFGESGGQQRLEDFYVYVQSDTSRFDEAMARAFSGADFVRKKRAGVDMSGEWTGRTIEEALLKMAADFLDRQIKQAILYVAANGTVIDLNGPVRQRKPITRTETVRETGRQSWDKHSKKESVKGT